MLTLADLTALTPHELWTLTAICFCAGLVRGFAGFALSALIMAGATFILPPVQLIPICAVLEGVASLLMLRGGMLDGNRPMVWRLVGGVAVGTPIGLALTVTLPIDASKAVALTIILALAALQLAKLRIPGLASPIGTYVAGAVSGVVSGLASVGGMVVALFVLAQTAPAASMRATLVLYLAVSMLVSYAWMIVFGMLTEIALWRGLVLTAPVVVGVLLGTLLFTPRWQGYYRPFCLCLLIALAAAGLARQAL